MGKTGKTSGAGKGAPSSNTVESVLAAAHGVIKSVPYAPKAGMHPATFITSDADGFVHTHCVHEAVQSRLHNWLVRSVISLVILTRHRVDTEDVTGYVCACAEPQPHGEGHI